MTAGVKGLKGHFCNAIHVKLKKQKFVFILF